MAYSFVMDGMRMNLPNGNDVPLEEMARAVQQYIYDNKGVWINIAVRNDKDLQLLGRAYDIVCGRPVQQPLTL